MLRSSEINVIMAGLVPAIPTYEAPWRTGNRDAWDKPAHDVNKYERDLH
jgi:hypothetical protein